MLDEIPLCAPMVNIREYDDDETRQALPQLYMSAREALREMIRRDYNHPCVIFWSVSNESREDVPQLVQMNDALIQYAKSLDDSRLAVHVSQGCWWTDPQAAGRLFTQDDVICINAYVTAEHRDAEKKDGEPLTAEDDRYAAEFWDEKLAVFHDRYPGKPIVVTEFGYPAEKASDGIMDEEIQRDVLLCDMRAMAGRLNGYAIWHFADHDWEIAENGGMFFGSRVSPYGVFTRDRGARQSAEATAKLWSREARGGR